jgi:HSP20 family protein
MKTNGPPAPKGQPAEVYTPLADAYATPEEVVVVCDLPGVKPQDIDLRFEPGELCLYAKVAPRPGAEGCVLAEYGVGDFYRSFGVGVPVDEAHITAEYKDGVLTVRLPRKGRVTPKPIPVQMG